MNLVNLLLSFGVFLMFSGMGVVIFLDNLDKDIGIEKVPCYDRYGNMIEGLICDDEFTASDKDETYILSVFLFILGIVLSMGLYNLLNFSPASW